MLAVSDRFLAALRETHAVAVAARVYRPGDLETPVDVPVLGGSLTIDADSLVRRQATLECALEITDPFTLELVRALPFGGWAVIERGIRYADGSDELLPLGYFRVESVAWAELQGRATLTLADRMAQVADERFLVPKTPKGKPSDVAVAFVQEVFGSSIAYHVGTTPATEAALVDTVYEEDRAQALADLAGAVDAAAYFDNLGDFVLRPHGSSGAPVWRLDAGDRGVLKGASETLDRSEVRNGVAVTGQADAKKAPFRGRATDDNPTSPTRWGGPFGKVPLLASSTAVASRAQADAAARNLLGLRLGLTRTTTLVGVPNPALEPGDAIEVVTPDGRSEVMVINALQIGLDASGDIELTTTSQYRPPAQAGVQASRTLVHVSGVPDLEATA